MHIPLDSVDRWTHVLHRTKGRAGHQRVAFHDGGQVRPPQRGPDLGVGVLAKRIEVEAYGAREQHRHLHRQYSQDADSFGLKTFTMRQEDEALFAAREANLSLAPIIKTYFFHASRS